MINTTTLTQTCGYVDDIFVGDAMSSKGEYEWYMDCDDLTIDIVVLVGMRIAVKNGMTRTTLYDSKEKYTSSSICSYIHISKCISQKSKVVSTFFPHIHIDGWLVLLSCKV